MFRACKGMFWKIRIFWQSGWGWCQLIQIIDALTFWDQIKPTVNIKFQAGCEWSRNHGIQSVLLNSCVCAYYQWLFSTEYPDSDPAVEDLKICLQKTDLRQFLVQKLQRALETRLLHPGVNTPDILTAYIAAIKALRQLDPTGVLLEQVTLPVRYTSIQTIVD